MVFLPKPGKASYRLPKSFRPISLSNYFLKGLERLSVWEMNSRLKTHPIHKKQHAFTKGKSTESALSATVNLGESNVFRHKGCLAVFLDISGAFDSIGIDHIRKTLVKHGGDDDLVKWYYNLLQERHVTLSLHGVEEEICTSQGFPQGGVASAKFWLIAFDQAIRIINKRGVEGNGYALSLIHI